jgi:hypothetical protein
VLHEITEARVDSTNWSEYERGTRTGKTWTFRAGELMGGKAYHGRYTMTLLTPKKMSFSLEMSQKGTDWAVMMDGTTEKESSRFHGAGSDHAEAPPLSKPSEKMSPLSGTAQ